MRHRIPVRRLVAALAMTAAVPTAALAMAAAPASASAPAEAAPAPECAPVVVKSAELVRTVKGPVIEVTGLMPHADTRLRLDPDPVVFIQQPEYFPYTVNGCDGTGPETKTPFTERFRVPTDPVGTFGITVNGIPVDLFPHILVDA